jgi:alkylation response protein AidB-like acyl-CoA dehydrogenase
MSAATAQPAVSSVSPAMVVERGLLPNDEFRSTMWSWLAANNPGRPPKGGDRVSWVKSWNALLVDSGWAAPSWPVEHGGMNLPFEKQVIYTEEIARADKILRWCALVHRVSEMAEASVNRGSAISSSTRTRPV